MLDRLAEHNGWLVYEIEYRYEDERIKNENYHNCYVCVYEKGGALARALEEDLEKVNAILRDEDLEDEDICFYVEYDRNKGWDLRKELEESFGIEVKEIYE